MSRVTKKTTESHRRHQYASFRERIDSIKVDPHLKVGKRVYDYLETSHFLSTLERWKEINLSKNFTEFLEETEHLSQSLPQILYHKDKIFCSLFNHLEIKDTLSLQPLLEILSQFIHDLGPDFMPYYQKYLNLVIRIALETSTNDSRESKSAEAIEWCFMCLAFTFKYLSKILVQNLVPTLQAFIPVLLMNRRSYLSRFSAESLSYLIKRLKSNEIREVISDSIIERTDLVRDNNAYCQSLVILFSECMKNINGTLRGCSKDILYQLCSILLTENLENQITYTKIICGIILEIIDHTTEEACPKFYEDVVNVISPFLLKTDTATISIAAITRIIICLCFANSGRKIVAWDPLFTSIRSLFSISLKVRGNDPFRRLLILNITYLLTLVIRNSDIQSLTKFIGDTYDFLSKHNDFFLGFAEATLNLSKSKVVNFGLGRLLSNYGDNITNDEEILKLSLFLFGIEWNIVKSQNISLINREIHTKLFVRLLYYFSAPESHLSSIFCVFLLLEHSDNWSQQELSSIIDFFRQISIDIEVGPFEIVHYIAAKIVNIITNSTNKVGQKGVLRLFGIILVIFERYKHSPYFLSALYSFFEANYSYLKDDFKTNFEYLISNLVHNMSLPSHLIRLKSISLVMQVYKFSDVKIPEILNQMLTIETTPLSIETARDVNWRIRNLATEFNSMCEIHILEKKLFVNFLFGLLSNKFQPCWDAVYSAVSMIWKTSVEEIWSSVFRFIAMDYTKQINPGTDGTKASASGINMEQSANSSSETFMDAKLDKSFFELNEKFFEKYYDPIGSMISLVSSEKECTDYESAMRTRCLILLRGTPQIANAHIDSLVFFLLQDGNEDYSVDVTIAGSGVDSESGGIRDEQYSSGRALMQTRWSSRDHVLLMEIFAKAENLKESVFSKEIYDFFLSALSSKSVVVQKISLDVLLRWGDGSIRKYKDDLQNLLDEFMFRDELSKLLTSSSDSQIEDKDLGQVMPLILRILFGRAQGHSKNSNKGSKRHAIVSSLPNLSISYVREFLELGIEKASIFNDGTDVLRKLPKIAGLINLLMDLCKYWGHNNNELLEVGVQPLLYSLEVAQQAAESKESDIVISKMGKHIRQLGFKCLYQLSELLPDSHVWEENMESLYQKIVGPRLSKFAEENLQQPSSLLKLIISWISHPNQFIFLYIDDYAVTKAILSLLTKENIKDSVLSSVLDFCLYGFKNDVSPSDNYFILLALIVKSMLEFFPRILNLKCPEVNSKAIELTLLLVEKGYVDDFKDQRILIECLGKCLDRSSGFGDRASILRSLSILLIRHECDFLYVFPLYKTCSKLLMSFSDRIQRDSLVAFFEIIGSKFPEIGNVSELLKGINANSRKRIGEPDFELRLSSFKKINENLYTELSPSQWLPLLYCTLYFINDEHELAIRSNASFTLCRFIDSYSLKENDLAVQEYVSLLEDIVLPQVRLGLRKKSEAVQNEHINVLCHIVENAKHFEKLDDLKSLFHTDEEANFFRNINHIQLHRRQRAIRRASELKDKLSDNSVSHYVLPLIEKYAYWMDERFRNIGNEATRSIGNLLRSVSWKQYRAIMRRYMYGMRSQEIKDMKNHVSLVVTASSAYSSHMEHLSACNKGQAEARDFALKEAMPLIGQFLIQRDEETAVLKIPLAEALVNLVIGLPENEVESELPGILTSVCQILRSHSEELRDASRKSLCQISNIVGPRYLKFVVQELRSALSRGSQIHVLSYTVHTLLTSIIGSLKPGDLNESVSIISFIIMEDIFGAAGQEKDSEGYRSRTKEVKHKKSFDTGEMVSRNISLRYFAYLLEPIERLLNEQISLKTQNKLEELLKRYVLGLSSNASEGTELLYLCYEVFERSCNYHGQPVEEVPKNENFFLVKVNSKPLVTHSDNFNHRVIIQKFSLDLLKTCLSRNQKLKSTVYLKGFIPNLEMCLNTNSEGVLIGSLRVLNTILKLPFPENFNSHFKSYARRALTVIKESPSTTSELCQASLKCLATIIRHRPDIDLKDTVVNYLLVRIQPDLEEPKTQGLAFNFLKAVISQHVMLPEVYETMDIVSKIMIVNHSKEIRDMSRSLYFQFLMEYDQGKGRLQKRFKFLLDNLEYATATGRQSVMELLHSIVVRSDITLLNRLASSFFLVITKILVNDDAPKCREMASTILSKIFNKLGPEHFSNFEKYCSAWLMQRNNDMLLRCGLSVYNVYCKEIGFGNKKSLDDLALQTVTGIIEYFTDESLSESEKSWQCLYAALSTFAEICGHSEIRIFDSKFEKVWKNLVRILLFPHSWIRLMASRLFGILLSSFERVGFLLSEYDVQTIGYRLLHQISGPLSIPELYDQAIKNLMVIVLHWEENRTAYQVRKDSEDEDDNPKYTFATDFVVEKICYLIRHDNAQRENFYSKKSGIQLSTFLIQVVSEEKLKVYTEKVLSALTNLIEMDNGNNELLELAHESMQLIEKRLGISEYTSIYTKTKQMAKIKRQERKSKRAQLAITAPEIATKRKQKKHERFREKRKHGKDENGYYKRKRKNPTL